MSFSARFFWQIACRALYDYVASRPDELSFPKDVIITNVQKHDGEWWRGDYKGQVGLTDVHTPRAAPH